MNSDRDRIETASAGTSIQFLHGAMLILLGVWVIYYNFDNIPGVAVLIAFIAAGFCGIYIDLIPLEIVSIAVINTGFIISALKFSFSMLNVIQIVTFQTGVLFVFESFWFRERIKTAYPLKRALNKVEKSLYKKMSQHYYLSILLVSSITFSFSVATIYVSLQTIIFSPNVMTVTVFALIVIACIVLIQLVRSQKDEIEQTKKS